MVRSDAPTHFVAAAEHVHRRDASGLSCGSEPADRQSRVARHTAPIEQDLAKQELGLDQPVAGG